MERAHHLRSREQDLALGCSIAEMIAFATRSKSDSMRRCETLRSGRIVRAAPFDARSLGMSGAVRFAGDRGALAGALARRSRPALADRVQRLPSGQHRDELRNPRRTGL